MKKKNQAVKPEFTTRSIHRKDHVRRWGLAAGIIFCTLLVVSFVKLEGVNLDDEVLHRSACPNEIVPIYLQAQGSFVPEQIYFELEYAPESTELVEFFANKSWQEKSRLTSDGKMEIELELNSPEVERDFATMYLRVLSDNIIKYQITEKSGQTELITGFDKLIERGEGC